MDLSREERRGEEKREERIKDGEKCQLRGLKGGEERREKRGDKTMKGGEERIA